MAISHTPVGLDVGAPDHRARLQARRTELHHKLGSILPAPARFVWEVGCGHGHFLTAYATQHSETPCVGVDIASDRIERAVRKRDRAKLRHLHFLQSEALFFLGALASDQRISATFVLFPDPWPKSRHHKHRVLQPEFLSQLAQHCDANAALYFRTDFRPYFDYATSVLRSHARWKISNEAWPFEFETVFQSRAAEHHSIIARVAPANS